MTDSYRGDSCGSFEFLTKSRRASSGRGLESEEDDEEDQRLFFPQRNEEKEAILRYSALFVDFSAFYVKIC